MALRDAGGPAPVFQWLIYPALDFAMNTESHRTLATGYFLTRQGMDWCRDCYLARPEDGEDWRASPLRARALAGLPPALVQTAGFDPLRDEGEAYALRLRTAGVAATHSRYDGMIHGFARMGGVIDAASDAIAEGADALRAAFAAA